MVDFVLAAKLSAEWQRRKDTKGCTCQHRTASFCYWAQDIEPHQRLPRKDKLCKCECHIDEVTK